MSEDKKSEQEERKGKSLGMSRETRELEAAEAAAAAAAASAAKPGHVSLTADNLTVKPGQIGNL